MTPVDQVSVPLALFDYVPVVLGAVGAFLVARRLGAALAYIGAAMIFAGGFAKATEKLLSATGIADIPRLADALFPVMGCGFLLLAASAWGVRNIALAAPVVGAAAIGVAVPDIAGRYLVGVIVGATALYAALARDAWRDRDVTTVAFLVVCLVGTYTLGPLAGQEQTVALQWVEQSINTFSQGAFAVAAWRLSVGSRNRVSVGTFAEAQRTRVPRRGPRRSS
ncbi:hypothetical protein WDY80_01510 [Gordonia hongkongensis]|uniref:hypothetical protein n=1 Tax=Gordonia hongkongensis TaxID=1701090 RepID=UPI001586A314